jgi:hypothetical protein
MVSIVPTLPAINLIARTVVGDRDVVIASQPQDRVRTRQPIDPIVSGGTHDRVITCRPAVCEREQTEGLRSGRTRKIQIRNPETRCRWIPAHLQFETLNPETVSVPKAFELAASDLRRSWTVHGTRTGRPRKFKDIFLTVP